MSPDALEMAGEALYGHHWQSRLSDKLEVGTRSIRRWLSGELAIPDGVSDEITQALHTRKVAIEMALMAIGAP